MSVAIITVQGRHRSLSWPPTVSRPPGDAVRGEHAAEQERSAVGGQHVPGQGHRVEGVTDVRAELPGHQEPETAVAQRGETARGHDSPPDPGWPPPSAGGSIQREGEHQHLHGHRSGRALGRIGEPFQDPGPQHGQQLLVQLVQFLGGQVEHKLAVTGGVTPFPRVRRLGLPPGPVPVELALTDQPDQGAGGDRGLRVVVGRGDRMADRGHPPGPGASLAAARFLDESVLRQLAQVKRARGRRLADQLADLGGGHRAADAQLLDDRDPHGVGQCAQGPRVGKLPQFRQLSFLTRVRIVERHVSRLNSRDITVKRNLSRGHSRRPKPCRSGERACGEVA